jgi:transposase-like protein
VAKRQWQLGGVDDLVISLVTGEVQVRLAEAYGAEVSRDTTSTITDQVLDGLAEWQPPTVSRRPIKEQSVCRATSRHGLTITPLK